MRGQKTADTVREFEGALDIGASVGRDRLYRLRGKAFCAGVDVSWRQEGKMGHTGPREFAPPTSRSARYPKTIREMTCGIGADSVPECDGRAEAQEVLFGLRLVKAALIEFQTIPLGPIVNWELLFAPDAPASAIEKEV